VSPVPSSLLLLLLLLSFFLLLSKCFFFQRPFPGSDSDFNLSFFCEIFASRSFFFSELGEDRHLELLLLDDRLGRLHRRHGSLSTSGDAHAAA